MIGERLKMLRKEKGLTMKEIGEIIGVSDAAWTKYEKNRAEPSIESLIKIADYFQVSLDFLLGRTNIREPQFVEKANIQSEFLKEFEWSKIGDPSQMYFLVENLSTSIGKYNEHKVTESELQLLLKTISDVVLYFNTLAELKEKDKCITKQALAEHRKILSQIIEDLNDILEEAYKDVLGGKK
ncbi:helix-turn-helix domain-containing protein [Thermoanaerobacter wiegelii]|uniref:Helix-turn-helix domain protein n=1 Tax=Thermoanaerobacter wiegelii Rt8.B1 TaxID=697303 RepID=G2MTW9_9THEO|nr:helix-turn-helix transcriptional regulator [Thermoanaerobacter wiegelii]AEM79504.1 helix-turn-helix domain protein [Thermoanaerobacter wiegelii Rt8.B1]